VTPPRPLPLHRSCHYTGRLADSGRVFDSSYERGRPLTFRVGVHEVITGWDLGILGGDGVPPMKEGGKRTLLIPAGAGCIRRA
jgi:peptidylprolyl isomerase